MDFLESDYDIMSFLEHMCANSASNALQKADRASRADPNPRERNVFIDSLPKLKEQQFVSPEHRGMCRATRRVLSLVTRDYCRHASMQTTGVQYARKPSSPVLRWRKWQTLWKLQLCHFMNMVSPNCPIVDTSSAAKSALSVATFIQLFMPI